MADIAAPVASVDVIVLDEALERLSHIDPEAAEVVKLRYFTGLTVKETVAALGASPRKVDGLWAYARAWLHDDLGDSET